MAQTSRRSGAKVKTGCKTCKVRRIKCDELKPSCRKCTSTGRKCDGYTGDADDFHVQVWNPRKDPKLRKEIPVLSVSDEGARYLEFYYHCAQPMLSSNFDREFWSRTTLQMAYAEPAVRHALIALGYLHSTEDGSMRNARSRFVGQRENGILLRHYNKSVRSLVDRMSEVSYRPEIGLVTCLLFVCIEFIRANYHTAFTHLTSGLRLISHFHPQDRHDSPFSSPSQNPSATVHPPGLCVSTMVQDELAPLFERAMACAMMYGVPIEDFAPIVKPNVEHYQSLRFSNVRELQISAHTLRNQSILHLRKMTRIPFLEPDHIFTADELSEQENMLACQRAWHKVVSGFVESQNLSESDGLVVDTTLMHWNVYHIWSSCLATTRQTVFDKHLPAFQAILNYARRILDSMQPKFVQHTARFLFEISFIPAVDFVAQRCRCPTTRREALALLERNPPREGLWDAQQHVLLNRRLIEIEEKEVDPVTGWPVERSRLWSSVIDANMDQNGGFWARFMKVDALHARSGLEQPELIEEFFIIDETPVATISASTGTP